MKNNTNKVDLLIKQMECELVEFTNDKNPTKPLIGTEASLIWNFFISKKYQDLSGREIDEFINKLIERREINSRNLLG